MNSSQEDNPYAAPVTGLPLAPPRDDRPGMRWHLGWPLVSAANMVVPLLLGWQIADTAQSRLGAAVAVAVLLPAGYVAGFLSRTYRSSVLLGGVVVAGSQVFPILQIIVGIISYNLVVGVLGLPIEHHDGVPRLLTLTSGFLAALFFGVFLILAATVIGLVIRTVRRRWRNAG